MKKICCVVLAVLCLLPCLAGCGKANAANEEPLIRSFVIGNSTAEIQPHTEDGETHYVIAITLPTDTDFPAVPQMWSLHQMRCCLWIVPAS